MLRDPTHAFLTSGFVYLETAAKARFHKRVLEVAAYEAFFRHAEWQRDAQRMLDFGTNLAVRHGLGPLDALHVAAAILLGADELVTLEKPEKSIHRAPTVRIVYLGI